MQTNNGRPCRSAGRATLFLLLSACTAEDALQNIELEVLVRPDPLNLARDPDEDGCTTHALTLTGHERLAGIAWELFEAPEGAGDTGEATRAEVHPGYFELSPIPDQGVEIDGTLEIPLRWCPQSELPARGSIYLGFYSYPTITVSVDENEEAR